MAEEKEQTQRPSEVSNQAMEQASSASSDTMGKDTAKASANAGVQKLLDMQGGKETQVPVAFRNLGVSAPDSGTRLVKTLPRAIVNTFGYDQVRWVNSVLPKSWQYHRPSTKCRQLIQDFTGVVNPGELLLVLGRPGSGCSTFLRAAANRSALSVTGDLSYAGFSHHEFHDRNRRETVYLPENDQHIPTLTVRQTLQFALRTNLPGPVRTGAELDQTILSLAQSFGLEHALDTKVGGGAVHGVSGGERKRVSIAEVFACGSAVQCFDNGTSGLDSSTALDFVKALRTLADQGQKTIMATLYQAGESIYENFDKVMLLDDGHEIFFGSIHDARPYFEGLGFVAERGETTSEFMTNITNPEIRKVRDGSIAASLHTPEDLARAFRNSTLFSQLAAQADAIVSPSDAVLQQADRIEPSRPINLYYPQQIWECLRREAQLINGKRQVNYQKWINTVILCLIVGSEYYDVSPTAQGAFTRQGVIFYAIIANAWMQYPELFDAHANRPIVERQSSLNMYRRSAVALARVLVDIPLIAIQHAFFMVAYYFLAHNTVQYTAGDFFFFYFVLFLSTLNFANLLRMFAYYVPTVEDCFRFGGIASTTTVYFAGFLIPVSEMFPVWSWLHYISPPRYTYEALLANEFHRIDLTCQDSLIPDVPGANLANQVCPIRGATAGEATVPGLQYVESLGLSYSHRWRNVGILFGFAVGYTLIGVFGSEFVQFTSQGGGQLVFAKRPDVRPGQQSDEKDPEKSAPVEDSSLSKKTDAEHSHIGRSLVWKDLSVHIGEKNVLKSITGFVRPGDLIALCGASGAGKTTLLTHLSQTNPVGQRGGELDFGNKPLGKLFKKNAGFAQQQDAHSPAATVREALEFSALLRQSSIYSHAEKLAYVDRVLDILDLTPVQNALIGDANGGLGVELTKRVTIAVELAARPSILFADEPTTGLDSQGAASVISYLKKLSKEGQAVIVTVHQPSATLFSLFDRVLALSSNGEQLYFGKVSQALPYFEKQGANAPPNANPAEFILETVGAGIQGKSEAAGGRWAQAWQNSEERQQVDDDIARIKSQQHQDEDMDEQRQFNTSVFSQTYILTKRMLVDQWRRPSYVYSKIWVHVIQAILIGFTFYQLGTSPHDLQSRAFSAFALIFLVNTIVNPILARFAGNRGLWKMREGPSRAYGWLALCNSSLLAEMPAIGFTGVVYYLLWYFLEGLPLGQSAGFAFVILMTYEVFEMTFGLLITAAAPDLKMAGMALVFLVTTCNWFNGVVVPYDEIQVFWRYWIYYLNPLTYLFGGVIIAVNKDLPVHCDSTDLFSFPAPAGQTCGEYAGSWAVNASAQLMNPSSTSNCDVCQFVSANQYLAEFNLYEGQLANNEWAYWAVFVLFTLSNIGLFYWFTWARQIKGWKPFYFA